MKTIFVTSSNLKLVAVRVARVSMIGDCAADRDGFGSGRHGLEAHGESLAPHRDERGDPPARRDRLRQGLGDVSPKFAAARVSRERRRTTEKRGPPPRVVCAVGWAVSRSTIPRTVATPAKKYSG